MRIGGAVAIEAKGEVEGARIGAVAAPAKRSTVAVARAR